jgi:hypothetical protein
MIPFAPAVDVELTASMYRPAVADRSAAISSARCARQTARIRARGARERGEGGEKLSAKQHVKKSRC